MFQNVCQIYFVFQIIFHQSTQLAVSCSKMTLFTPDHKNSGGKPRSEVNVRFGQPAGHQRATSVQPAGNTSGQPAGRQLFHQRAVLAEILLGISHCVATMEFENPDDKSFGKNAAVGWASVFSLARMF